jgi:hypothetical protein
VAASFGIMGLVLADRQPDSSHQPPVEELLLRLEQRDALIKDLQKRVSELERRVSTIGADRLSPAHQPSVASKSAFQAPQAASAAAAAPNASPPAEGKAPPAKDSADQLAPGQFEVDEEAAERALERTLVITGALLLPYGQVEIQPSFSYSRREQSAPVLLSRAGRQFVAEQNVRRDILDGDLFLRLGLPFDAQLEFNVPYRSIERENVAEVGFAVLDKTSTEGAGFGDVRLGLAKTLLRERHWWPDLIARITWDADSGETDDGILLGSSFNELLGSLTMIKRQDPLVFFGSGSYGVSLEKNDITPGDQLGFSLGVFLAASPETSLRAFLNQTFVDNVEIGKRVIDGTDQVIGTLNFGASSIVGRGKFVDLTAGIGLTDDAPDYSVGLSFVMRFNTPFLTRP